MLTQKRQGYLDWSKILSKEYRQSIALLTRTSLRATYQGTFLGMAWSLLNPFIQVIIYALVFSVIARFSTKHYSLYLVCGIVPWGLVGTVLPSSAASLVSRSQILKHSLVSKTIFPLADTLKATVFAGLSFVAMYVPLAIWYQVFRWQIILLPVAVLPLLIFCFAWSIIIAFWAPFMRDLSHLISVGLRALFWLTPIVYPIKGIMEADGFHFMYWPLTLNPIRYLIEPIQIVAYGVDFSFWETLAIGSLVALVSVGIAIASFIKLHNKVVFYV